jgi:crossover junction endodeoxyribonuclease RuvC
MKVIGVDLSLRSTGVAGRGWADRIAPGPNLHGLDRLRHIRAAVLDFARGADLCVIEGPSYGSQGAGQHERAGAWWLVVEALSASEIPVAVVPPTCRARYACGKGNASKDQVLIAAVRRYPDVDIDGNDAADAVILAAMGADWLGEPWAQVPAAHRTGLDGVRWPEAAE